MELRNSKLIRLPLAAVFVCFLLPISCWADTVVARFTYRTVSQNNQYVWVMLAPVAEQLDAIGQRSEIREEALQIRTKYKTGGLYRNDGSTTPLWTVDWYAYQVLVPNDGIRLVRRGPWASDSSDEALTFYESGREIQSYKVRDLVDFTWFLPHSVSHFTWVKTIELDDARRTLELVTQYDDRYRFDLATGKIVYSWRRSRIVAGGGLLAVSALVFLSAMLLKRRSQRRRESANKVASVAS